MWALRSPTLAMDAAAIAKVLVGYGQVMHVFTRYYLVTWPRIVDAFFQMLDINISIANAAERPRLRARSHNY